MDNKSAINQVSVTNCRNLTSSELSGLVSVLGDAGQLGNIVRSMVGEDAIANIEADGDIEAGLKVIQDVLCPALGLPAKRIPGQHVTVDKETLAQFFLTYTRLIAVTGPKQEYDQFLIFNRQLGIYLDAEVVIGRLIANLLNSVAGDVWSSALETEMIKLLRHHAKAVASTDLNQTHYVFDKQALNLATLTFEPFSPDHLATFKTRVEPSKVPTPNWDHFLETTFDDPMTRSFTSEWMGFQLEPRNVTDTVLFLFAPGGNGKSTYLSVIRRFVGRDNVSNQRLQDLGQDFGLQPLLNKVSLISDESSAQAFPVDRLKLITGDDEVTVAQKYKGATEAVLRVKATFAFNKLPTPENSAGFSRRLILLEFPHTFIGKPDKDLSKKLRDEAPGIAWQAIEALKSLRANDYCFTQSPQMIKFKSDYLSRFEPAILKYLKDAYEVAPGNRIERSTIFPNFQVWCSQSGVFGHYTPTSFWRLAKDYWQVAFGESLELRKSNGTRMVVNIKKKGDAGGDSKDDD
ncbi:DNA primase family protein [Levilactobacillus brevis]|uniref:DNA primase family protein n=1 Tax=Levilactobacillus brevis TaxID=1580 RepID=UPI00111B28F6|nr:phage/plasmid primase, P4 family [Levilactobacillus brevis]